MSRFAGQDLCCVRGDRTVFRGLGFAVEAGGALLLTGPNGSGKSSLLRLMAGLARPAEGSVGWDDGDLGEDPEWHFQRLHYVGHLDGVKSALSVAENLAVWARLRGGDGAVDDALARFGLAQLSDIPARLLSAGQRRRLALARIAASPAELWLLDEPTVALDRGSVAALLATIEAHRASGGMAVIATNVDFPVADSVTLDVSQPGSP